MTKFAAAASLIATLFASPPAWSHGDSSGRKSPKSTSTAVEEQPFGKPGDPKKVTRTIRVDMVDTMHFRPGNLVVKQGETIRFIVANKGKVMHEMVIGTMKDLKAHAELMKKHPGMEHDEPYMAHVTPGRTGTIVWEFTRAGEFHYACLVGGHMEAGMVNKITVAAK